jgi:hypothetical protein
MTENAPTKTAGAYVRQYVAKKGRRAGNPRTSAPRVIW